MSRNDYYNRQPDDDFDSTREIPVVNEESIREYERQRSQAHNPLDDGDDDGYIQVLDDLYIDNIPDKYFHEGYVSPEVYHNLFIEASIYQRQVNLSQKAAEDYQAMLAVEKEKTSNAEKELYESNRLREAAERGQEGRSQALDERENDLNRLENGMKVKKWILYGITALLVILLSVVTVLLFNEKSKNAEVVGDTSISKQRAEELDSALESERTARSNLEKKNQELEKQTEDMRNNLAEKDKKVSDLEGQIKQRDEQLKSLSERVDELTDVKAETITQTVPADPVTITQRAPGEAQTVTETVTANNTPPQSSPTTNNN